MSHNKAINQQDPRAGRSRRALLDAAIELFLVNPVASMSDLAAHAGVGRATLYRHFETREQLVRALAQESQERIDDVLQPISNANLPARETLEAGLRSIMPIADRFHFLLLLWNMCDEGDPAWQIYQRQLDDLAVLIERGKQEKSISKKLATSWIVMLVDSLVYVGWWSVSSGEMSAEEAAEQAVASLFCGISAA